MIHLLPVTLGTSLYSILRSCSCSGQNSQTPNQSLLISSKFKPPLYQRCPLTLLQPFLQEDAHVLFLLLAENLIKQRLTFKMTQRQLRKQEKAFCTEHSLQMQHWTFLQLLRQLYRNVTIISYYQCAGSFPPPPHPTVNELLRSYYKRDKRP